MEMISTTQLFIFLAILLIISAFFSGTETSMMAVNRNRLKALKKKAIKKQRWLINYY
jgi:Mg2+/Co2+ transporter CorB